MTTQDDIVAGAEAVLGAVNPAAAAALHGVIAATTALIDLLRKIKADDPALWAAVQSDYKDAVAGFEASVAAHHAD